MRRTLFLTSEFPPHVGGVSHFYFQLCRQLPSDEIIVLTGPDPKAAEFDAKQPFKIIRHSFLRPAAGGALGRSAATLRWLRLPALLKKLEPSLKFENIIVGQILPLGTVAFRYAKKTQTPYFIFAHGMDILVPQAYPRKRFLLKTIIGSASGYIANSHFTKHELQKIDAPAEKITVIQPGPNLERPQTHNFSEQQLRQKFKLPDGPILLSVGRLVKRKGHDKVLEALPLVAVSVPDVVYVIAGAGPMLPALKQLAKKFNVEKHVYFLTAQNDEALAELYELCQVFVLPARQLTNGDVEGYGIVYIEAALFGKPSLAGKVGGATEAVLDQQTGLLVNPENPSAIAQAAIQLLTNPALRERLGTQAMDYASHLPSWRTKAQQLNEALRKYVEN